MPQEPKKRHSRQRQGKRRASISLHLPSFISCPNCGNPMTDHSVCANCGFYKGRDVLNFKTKRGKLREKENENSAGSEA